MRTLVLRWLGLRVCGACGCVVAKRDSEAHAKLHADARKGALAGAVYR
jgi:hypothetical protein